MTKTFQPVTVFQHLQKLDCYGIRGVARDWFKSSLHNRKQFVFLGNISSDTLPISYGVPQGSWSVFGAPSFSAIYKWFATLCQEYLIFISLLTIQTFFMQTRACQLCSLLLMLYLIFRQKKAIRISNFFQL